MDGKTWLEHLTCLRDINARPNLDILTQNPGKDAIRGHEKLKLADAIMGMYQMDTSHLSVDVQGEGREECMSTWVNNFRI